MYRDPRAPILPGFSIENRVAPSNLSAPFVGESSGVVSHIILVWETGQKSYVGWDAGEGELFLSSRPIPGETIETWDIEWTMPWAYANFPIHKGQRFAGEIAVP